MALFKILKGPSSRIDTTNTPLHEGYAYYTSDDGGFYIDDSTKRQKINAGTEMLFADSSSTPTPASNNAIWFVTETTDDDSEEEGD